MKDYLIVLIFLLSSSYANSQVLISLLLGDKLNSDGMEFGLETGYNFASISGMDSHKSLGSFNIGFYFDIRMDEPWYFYTGVLVKSRLGGHKLSAEDLEFLQVYLYPEADDYSQKLNYFLVPTLIKYKMDNHIYFEAGPQFGLMHKAWVEYN